MSRPGGSRNNNPNRTNASSKDPKSNERNEYIPSFIAKKPFYIDDATASQDDYLEHQRLQQSQKSDSDSLQSAKWYERGKVAAVKATKYRKGACENCGSMSHKEKDCLQRKRKHGAKWTGRDIAEDEVVQEVKLGWDAKRDRWNGFESGEYGEVVEDYNALEDLKKKRDEEGGGEDGEGDEDAERGVKYEAESDMGRKQATSTRNLRLREDTAKYLLNLDLDSAKYDPKTRSMLDTETSTNELIAEDGFQKASGDAAEFERAQQYAWETQERGDKEKIHMQANPTEAVMLRKRKAEEDLRQREEKKKFLADRYGAQADDANTDKQKMLNLSALAANEKYVEYDDRGRVKGLPERKEKSIYVEDVFINNHKSVWGSWWKSFQWGYACCHSTVKNSFCVGEEGRMAVKEAEDFRAGKLLTAPDEIAKEEAQGQEERNEKLVANGLDGAGRLPEDANDRSRQRLREMKDGVTEEEMEKYRRERVSKNDPMANMLGKDELLGV